MENWTQLEYLEWYRQFLEDDWEDYIQAAQEYGMKYKEYKILLTMKQKSNSYNEPSFSQMQWAKKIIERLDFQLDKENFEETFKKANNCASMNTKHLTVRMAWHDNFWNGHICQDPENNIYCNGYNSLLSDRIRRRKQVEIEKQYSGRPLPEIVKNENYVPPCFWSINAFGNDELPIIHDNPANDKIVPIKESLHANSVFSWPFKLSFVRDNKVFRTEGKYPKNLEDIRIPNFQNKLVEKNSIVFLYANYDNPISGDDNISGIRPAYLLVGCALLANKKSPTRFTEPQEEFDKAKKRPHLQNFPNINWAIQYSLDHNSLVRLPYHEYLLEREKIKNQEDREVFDKEKMSKLKVTITEPELIHCFKYVAMDVDDDEAIYLLSKIRYSLYSIKNQGIVSQEFVNDNIERVDKLLKNTWDKRGYFPGLPKLCRLAKGLKKDDKLDIDNLLKTVFKKEQNMAVNKIIELFNDPEADEEYSKFEDSLYDIKEYFEDIKGIDIEQFFRLSLLNLTFYQFDRILKGEIRLDNYRIDLKEIAENPYLLYEEYECRIDHEDPYTGDQLDNPIELFKIDIAYFPDTRYLKRHKLQRAIKSSDKRRVISLIIQYLQKLENYGHCFDVAENIQEALKDYPLFYKIDDEYQLPNNLLNDFNEEYEKHLKLKLHIEPYNNKNLYYLLKIYDAEIHIKEIILKLLKHEDINIESPDFIDYIETSANQLSERLRSNFEKDQFIDERLELFGNIFRKRFYVLGGSPGSGKSYELLKVISEFKKHNEEYLLLAPTGKAVLRLRNEEGFADIKAMTIDKFIHDRINNRNSSTFRNLIIDEMSMVDLLKLAELFNLINFDSPNFKRLIFVGDQYQLPPIGYGKVFIDTLNYLKLMPEHRDHFIELETNCRQKLDNEILDFSKIFSNQNKNYEEYLMTINKDIQISENFHIYYWKNKEELYQKFEDRLCQLHSEEINDPNIVLNELFNLDEDGNIIPNQKYNPDGLQLLSPYRTNYYGTIKINHYFQNSFRASASFIDKRKVAFKHSDKIYQTKNKYDYETKELVLSNGSIGIAQKNKKLYFPEYGKQPVPDKFLNSEELDLAYCLTVHKSQGSGFDNIFLYCLRNSHYCLEN